MARVEQAVNAAVAQVKADVGPARKRMPRERQSITHKFSLGGHEGYITAGMYEDGTVGEIFLTNIGAAASHARRRADPVAAAVQATLFHHGVSGTPEKLRTREGHAFLARLDVPANARERIEIAMAMIEVIEAQIAPLERELRQLARRQAGCRALMGLMGWAS
jgi:hypothetical protein